MNTRSTSKKTRRSSGVFSRFIIDEPTVEDTISILRGIKDKYELHHGVRITDGGDYVAAAGSCLTVTFRTVSCPTRRIDLMDEAGSSRIRMEVGVQARERSRRSTGGIIQLKIEGNRRSRKRPIKASKRTTAYVALRAPRTVRTLNKAIPKTELTTRWQRSEPRQKIGRPRGERWVPRGKKLDDRAAESLVTGPAHRADSRLQAGGSFHYGNHIPALGKQLARGGN